MNKHILDLFTEEKASIAVMTAIGLVVFLGMLAMVGDIGILYLHKTRLANAVDSAVMAGAQELPDNAWQARQVAESYGVNNGLDLDQTQVQVDSDAKGLAVTATRKVNFFFAQVLGFNQGSVRATAKAKIGVVTTAQGVAPLAIEQQDFVFGQEYTLKEGHGMYGWFGPLSLDGSGNSRYEANLKYGYPEIIKVGDILPTETGNMSGGTRRGIEYRMSQCPHGGVHNNPDEVRDCPMILIIPVIAAVPDNAGQPRSVKVVGFAAFLPSEVGGNGNESIIKGTFIRTVIPGDISFGQTDYGVRGVKLTN